jgi:hypothetical protein
MTLDQFRQLAETWGGDIDRWPATTQEAARKIAARPEGLAVIDEHRRLDTFFAAAPEVSATRAGQMGFAVLRRIARAPAAPPWYRRMLQPASLLPAAGLTCSILVGTWLAGSLPYHRREGGIAVVSMVFDSSAVSLWGVQ